MSDFFGGIQGFLIILGIIYIYYFRSANQLIKEVIEIIKDPSLKKEIEQKEKLDEVNKHNQGVLINKLDKVVKHIKNQIEFNTIIHNVIGEEYKPLSYYYIPLTDEIENILKSWNEDNEYSERWAEVLKDSKTLYTSVLKEHDYYEFQFADGVFEKVIKQYKPKKYKENFTNEELLKDLNKLIEDSKKFFNSSGYLEDFLPYPTKLKKHKNLILFLTTNMFNKTTEDLKYLYKDKFSNDGESFVAKKIYKIPTINKKMEEYIKDNINFNDFVGKDEDYIRNEIPGVGKPTAKKILEIVNKDCTQDVERLKETLDILNIKDA